ncbi:MAG: glycoside hydrolase family 28 protein [Verrucomicrobia bacterium]|nr:glycoside hydrolase family 28 protein [Verrucomicrobiota bacterium]
MRRREFVSRLGAVGLAAAGTSRVAGADTAAPPRSGSFNPHDFGARGDGAQLDTKALQAAIDACAKAGGGTVALTAGTYLSGTLFLRSRVQLHLEPGATLLGSKNLADYPPTVSKVRSYTDNYTERSLIYAEDLDGVAITGLGRIDGQGAAFKGPYKVRPYLIRVIACRGVTVRDVTILDSPMWVQHYLACDHVLIDGITVRSKVNANNDGIDIDGCHQVRIANCDISSGDDAIVLKSTLDRACQNVVVTNCVLSSDCNAFKLGTESNGGFENIALSNCAIHDTRLAGLAVEMVDGGLLERVSVANIVMRNVACPIFVRLGHRARPFKEGMDKPGLGRLRSVTITDVQADGANRVGCSITGLPEHPAEDITLENIHLSFAGGGTEADARRAVPEHPEKYPEYAMFGTLPAYGFYCRHVKRLRFSNVRLESAAPEARPALVCDDVEDLELFRWRAETLAKAGAPIRFTDVRRALLHGCRGPEDGSALLRVEGKASARIKLTGNDLTDAKKAVELGNEAAAGAVSDGAPF